MQPGVYTFTATLAAPTERVRLWLDNRLVLDQWVSLDNTERAATADLARSGHLYEAPPPPHCCPYPCPYCTLTPSLPTVAPTRVPTVHSLPPSLLLPLPVSLLYTHSLPP